MTVLFELGAKHGTKGQAAGVSVSRGSAGRGVPLRCATVACDLRMADQWSCVWRKRERSYRGREPGTTSAEQTEPPYRTTSDSEARDGVCGCPRVGYAAHGHSRSEWRFAAMEVMAAGGLSVEMSYRVLGISS